LFTRRVGEIMDRYHQQTAGIRQENARRQQQASQQQAPTIIRDAKGDGRPLPATGVPLLNSKPELLPLPPAPDIIDPEWTLAVIGNNGTPTLQGFTMREAYDYEAQLVKIGYGFTPDEPIEDDV